MVNLQVKFPGLRWSGLTNQEGLIDCNCEVVSWKQSSRLRNVSYLYNKKNKNSFSYNQPATYKTDPLLFPTW